MANASSLAHRASELRDEFDISFSQPPLGRLPKCEELIAIRAGGARFALRISEIAGLHADKKITPVAGVHAALLGLAAFRGVIVPIYDVGILLGGNHCERPRWLVLAAAEAVGVAFEEFEGRFEASSDAIKAPQAAAAKPEVMPQFVRSDEGVRPIIHLSSLVAELGK